MISQVYDLRTLPFKYGGFAYKNEYDIHDEDTLMFVSNDDTDDEDESEFDLEYNAVVDDYRGLFQRLLNTAFFVTETFFSTVMLVLPGVFAQTKWVKPSEMFAICMMLFAFQVAMMALQEANFPVYPWLENF